MHHLKSAHRKIPSLFCLLVVVLAPVGFVAVARAAEKTAAKASAPKEWQSLFDGSTLAGWKSAGFEGGGAVKVENPFRNDGGAIVMETGTFLSGITWTNATKLPTMNYELTLEAMKLDGSDFFCGLTFPVGETACSFICGGWGGGVVGISSIDGNDASENETSESMGFELNRWYTIRVRVTPGKLEAWIDDRKMVDFVTTGRKISLRFGDIENCLPLGVAAYQTRTAVREIRVRKL